jgi:hypothetical protein
MSWAKIASRSLLEMPRAEVPGTVRGVLRVISSSGSPGSGAGSAGKLNRFNGGIYIFCFQSFTRNYLHRT